MIRGLPATLSALALAACGPSPADQPRELSQKEPPTRPAVAQAPAPGPPPDAQRFVDEAAGVDAFELMAAELALARTKDARVRQFAGLMVRDHKTSSLELQKAVTESGYDLVPSPSLPERLQKRILELTTADLADFDRAYIGSQVAAHEAALEAMQRYAEGGQAPSLQAFASGTAPVVRQHHAHAQRLLEQLDAR